MKKPSNLAERRCSKRADDPHRVGIVDDATCRKIMLRHLRKVVLSTSSPISGEEIRTIRETLISAKRFCSLPDLTVGYVSQLERGAKQLKGPALTLLNVMRRKGFEAIL